MEGIEAPELAAEVALSRATIHEDYGDQQQALVDYTRAATLAAEGERHGFASRAWLGASLSSLRLGQPEVAREHARRSVATARAARDPVAQSEALRALGNAEREVGRVSAALGLYRQAVRRAREGGSAEGEAKALNNLGTVCQWTGLIVEATAAFERSSELKERLGLRASALITKNNLGQLYLAVGRLDDAERELSSIVGPSSPAAPVIAALANSNLGDLAVLRGHLDKAVDYYRRGHEQNRERSVAVQDSHALCGLTRALLMRDKPDEARRYLSKFDELEGRAELSESRQRHCSATAAVWDYEGDSQRALDSLRPALDDSRMRFSDVFATALEVRLMEAVLLARLGRRKQAARRLEGAAKALGTHAAKMGDERAARRFVAASPVHRAIEQRRLDAPRGWYWPPDV